MNSRRDFLSLAGKGLGLAALSTPAIGALVKEVEAATRRVAHLTPEQAAVDEDYWSIIQNSFTVTRGIVNLNNGGVSPSPRIVTERRLNELFTSTNNKGSALFSTAAIHLDHLLRTYGDQGLVIFCDRQGGRTQVTMQRFEKD